MSTKCIIGNTGSQNHFPSTGNLEHAGPSTHRNENVYEIIFEEKETETEDFYLELNEFQMRDYERFLSSNIQTKKSLKSLNVVGGNKLHNHLLEWSQLLQKICIQENPSNTPNENDDKLFKAYETILKLDERNWYEEMVLLYKVNQPFISQN